MTGPASIPTPPPPGGRGGEGWSRGGPSCTWLDVERPDDLEQLLEIIKGP